ncbi:MAG: hypothetical protein O7D91_04995, partial [Planctomycetota bacterium]|nr:hypothetical protein [Planctomycetota bacterium]
MRLTRRMGPDYRACARGRLLRLFVWSSCLVAVLTLRPFAAAQDARPGFGEDEPRITTSAPIFFDKVDTVRVRPSGSVSDVGVRTASAGLCELQSTYTDADFDGPGDFSIVFGLAETEIFAASYTLASEFFPIEIQSVEMVFAQTGVEDTVTELELLILKGTPDQNQIVGAPIPHTLDFTTTEADAINVLIDLSANPVLVENNGTNTFSVGFRIVTHNNQTENPCSFNPPPNSNAFPTVDASGVQHEADNWLFLVNCGPLSCPAFWNPFETLGSCAPVGDWVLRATWAPTVCPVAGACCLLGGGCEDLFESECQTQEGTFLGEETTCASSTCPEACCFIGGTCLPLEPEECLFFEGTPQGPLTDCSDNDGNGAADICKLPTGACCLANGGCEDDVNSVACETGGGAYKGDGTLCASVDCFGACCFGADGLSCGDLTGPDCDQIPNSVWQGPQLSCADFPCSEAGGACCQSNGVCDGDQTAVQCENAGGIFQGNGTTCASPEVQCDPFGACCFDNGGCDITCNEQETAGNCTALGGNYQGDGNDCSTCETCEACCIPCTQACLNLLPSVCLDFANVPQGEGSTCANTACDAPLGACCGPEPDICHDLFEFDCNTVGGIWQGCEILCSDQVNCAAIGACCLPNETCVEVQVQSCESDLGLHQGIGTVCVPGLCVQVECEINSDCDDGIACNGAETCLDNVCQDGSPQADGTPCDDGDACNTGETCTGGVCGGGSAVVCPDPNTDDCEFPVCNPAGAEGNCLGTDNETDGTPCSDGVACTENDQCAAGSCGGTAVN